MQNPIYAKSANVKIGGNELSLSFTHYCIHSSMQCNTENPLRGRHPGCPHLLPTVTLTCVGVDVPQGPRQECSDHKCCKRNAHHGYGVQTVENCWGREILYVNLRQTLQFYICFTSTIRKAEHQLIKLIWDKLYCIYNLQIFSLKKN